MRAVAIIPLCVCLLSSAGAKPPLLLNYQDGDGQYNFGYSDPLSMRTESRTVDGVTRGTYSYYDQNGAIQTTEYEAGKDIGFRVKATNLPEAPLPVVETPEVKIAREKHLQLLEEANRREEEEKRRLSLVDQATTITESSVLGTSAIPEAKIAPVPQEKVSSTQILSAVDVQSQPLPEAKIIPSASLKEDVKSATFSEPALQTISALPLQQQQIEEQTANLRAQPSLSESSTPAPQPAQAVVQKQEESSKDRPNQGPQLQPNILSEQRAFAAQNPFLLPFLGQGFSFESTLPQQRDHSIQQGQEKISAESINSELPTSSIQSRISEAKQSTQLEQGAIPVPGIQGRAESQIQNIFSDRAFSSQNGSPSGISTRQFTYPFPGLVDQPIDPKQTSLTEQRSFPSQNGVLGQQRLSIQGALPQQQLAFLTPNGFSGQQGFPIQDALLQQRTAPAQTVVPSQQGFPTLSTHLVQSEQSNVLRQPIFPEQRTVLAQGGLPDGQVFPSTNGFFGQGFLNHNALLRQQGFSTQQSFSGQQTIPRQILIPGQQIKQSATPQEQVSPQQVTSRHNAASEQKQGVNSGEQFIQQQSSILEQQAIPKQNVISEQQGAISQEGAITGQQSIQQSSIHDQQAIPKQNVASEQQQAAISEQGKISDQPLIQQGSILDQQAIPKQNVASEQQQGAIPQQGVISGQQFIQQQSSIIDLQGIPKQNLVPQQEQGAILQQGANFGQQFSQQAIPRQNIASEQQGAISQQGTVSGQQFIQQQSSILEPQTFPRQNVASEQKLIPQQTPVSGQQFIQQQGSILEQQVIPRQNAVFQGLPILQPSAISGQQFIQQQSSQFGQQVIPKQNAALEQQPILQPSIISEQQFIQQQRSIHGHQSISKQKLAPQQELFPQQPLIPQYGPILEQQIPLQNVITKQKEITQQNATPEQQAVSQQNLIPDQQAIARQIGFPEQLFGQQSAISGQQNAIFGQQSAISGQQRITQIPPFFGQQEISRFNIISGQQSAGLNQDGLSRQSVAEQQSFSSQVGVPEQRGAPQNLTPGQESLPKGFSVPDQRTIPGHPDQTNLQAEPSNLAAIRIPEPMRLLPVIAHESVKYTPEVMAAREAHFRAYAIAARLAEESDRNPQILIQLLKGSAPDIAQIAQRENQLGNEGTSTSAISSTTATIIENAKTKSAEERPARLPEVLPEAAKASENRIESLAAGPTPEARKIESAQKLQPFNIPNGIEQPTVRTGLTPASTSLRVMDTRLPSLNEFQQSKLKEALALTCDTSLKVTEDKEVKTKDNRHLLIVKPVEIAPIVIQKDSSMQRPPVPKNWAFQYVYL